MNSYCGLLQFSSSIIRRKKQRQTKTEDHILLNLLMHRTSYYRYIYIIKLRSYILLQGKKKKKEFP